MSAAVDTRPIAGSPEPTVATATSLVPGLVLVGLGTLAADAVSNAIGPLSTLVAAVIVGAMIGNLGIAADAASPGLRFAAKRLLRVGVVLLGLRLSLGDLTALGVPTLAVIFATVTATFFGTQWLGRRLGLSSPLALLVATGFSICGASAIAAVEGSTDADEDEVAAAIGLVTLFGSLAIVVLPLLSGWLGLAPVAFGTWVGASVHDVAQVVATASTGGSAVVAVAVVVKLTRVALLAPIVAGINLNRRRTTAQNLDSAADRPPVLPMFVVGFCRPRFWCANRPPPPPRHSSDPARRIGLDRRRRDLTDRRPAHGRLTPASRQAGARNHSAIRNRRFVPTNSLP